MAKPRTYAPRVHTTATRLAVVANWVDSVAEAERQVELFRRRGGPAPLSNATEASLLAIVDEKRECLRRAEAEHGTEAALRAQYDAEHPTTQG